MKTGSSVQNQICSEVWVRVKSHVNDQVGLMVWLRVDDQVRVFVSDNVWWQIGVTISHQVKRRLNENR